MQLLNWRLILPALAILFLSGIVSYNVGYYLGYKSGKEVVRVKNLEKDLDRSKKNAAIRNNRPSTSGVVNRLRDGSF